MRITFTPTAQEELTEAQAWYEEKSPGLGRRMRGEVGATLARMLVNPRQFAVVESEARRAPVSDFPYSLFFLTRPDRLIVIACFHSSRNPHHWRSRI